MEAAAQAWEGRALGTSARQQRYARALMAIGELDGAAALVVDLAPGALSAEGHLVLGVWAADEGLGEQALGHFDAGLALAPLPELVVNRCVALRELRQPALVACREAIRAAPEDPRGFLALAEEAIEREVWEVAEEAMEAAWPALESQRGFEAWASPIFIELGQWERACTLGARAGASHPSVAEACWMAGEGAATGEILDRVALDDPQAAPLRLRLAVDEASAAPLGPARGLAVERARRWARQLPPPLTVAVLTDLGRLELLDGEPAAAELRWREALALAPREPAPRLNLSRLLWERGAKKAALELLNDGVHEASPDGVAVGIERARRWVSVGRREESQRWAAAARVRCEAWSHQACLNELDSFEADLSQGAIPAPAR